MKYKEYIKHLERIEKYYEFGTIFFFAFGCACFAITFVYASLVSFVSMGIFAFNKRRIMKKIKRKRK